MSEHTNEHNSRVHFYIHFYNTSIVCSSFFCLLVTFRDVRMSRCQLPTRGRSNCRSKSNVLFIPGSDISCGFECIVEVRSSFITIILLLLSTSKTVLRNCIMFLIILFPVLFNITMYHQLAFINLIF